MEYKVIAEWSDKIDQIVSAHLDSGWILYGDPFSGGVDNKAIRQAMIKPSDNPTVKKAYETYMAAVRLING